MALGVAVTRRSYIGMLETISAMSRIVISDRGKSMRV